MQRGLKIIWGRGKTSGAKAHINSYTLYAALEGLLFHDDTRIQVTRETREKMDVEPAMTVR
jgi:hypothetical protein